MSVFKGSRIVTRSRYGESGPGPKGSIMAIAFQLEGQDFVAINAGGGQVQACSWLKDRYGLSWQLNYAGLQDTMGDVQPDRVDKVMQAMLQMKKIDIQRLKDAYEGR